MVVARPEPGQWIRNILTYQVNSSTEWGGRTEKSMFCPNVYYDISETINIKLKALEMYTDELRAYPHPRSLEAVENRAKVFGNEVGLKYAEAFKLVLSRGEIK